MPQYIPKYFKHDEFACPCCGFNNINDDLLILLDQARGMAGRPFAVNSGCRCDEHNAEVGGSTTSTHLAGRAVDIACPDDRARGAILAALIRSGIRRIGIGKTFIHADIDPQKSGAVWLY